MLTTSQLTAGTRLKTTLEIGLWDESSYANRTHFEWPGETPPKEPEGLPPITQPEELIGGKYLPVGTIVTVQTILYHSSAYQCIRASADIPDSSGAPQAQTGFLYTTHNDTDQVKLCEPPKTETETEPGPGPQPPEPPGSQPGDVQIEVHAGQTVVIEVKSTTTATTDTGSVEQPTAPVPPQEWVIDHMFQEYHSAVSNTTYAATADAVKDSKVVEKKDGQQQLQPKEKLHLCFLEATIATFKATVPPGQYSAKWEIIDASGAVVLANPKFAQLKMENKAWGWWWDGRNNAKVFCPEGDYRSRLTIKNARGEEKVYKSPAIKLEGNPYHVVVVGQPKSDEELERQLSAQIYLDTNGERTARDCWIKVYRGIKNEDDVDKHEGHMVFLGQGGQEATGTGAANGGYIAVPHGRWFKGWRRVRPFPDPGPNLGVLQFEDIGKTEGMIALHLHNPPANNPYCASGGAFKDQVQAHPGNPDWTTEVMSYGCTTISPTTTSFGSNPDGIVKEFTNKQTHRANRTSDALDADDHSAPLLKHSDGTEQIHMQPTFQQAVFGGFLLPEVPADQSVEAEPQDKARIRLILRPYLDSSLYYLYHHAVAFGHDFEKETTGSYKLRVWIPRKVIRGWNGNFRNLLVRGRCTINWCIERRPDADTPVVVHNLLHPNSPSQDYETLPSDIPLTRNWTPTVPLAPGTYVSILRYRISVLPSGQEHDWVGAPNMKDLLSKNSASLQTESNDGTFLYGSSELYIPII